ncbi:DUF7482 domain-containing protein [Roseateles paludis]|jgi:hypothetical protein|uniref:DUF7482 domain-containing protein n=1 Tax=Roseateles paludis TaxID=3145238 RepID=A0ABV0G3C7_9BURK
MKASLCVWACALGLAAALPVYAQVQAQVQAQASPEPSKTETVLRLQRAWVDGRQVEYISTDVSDPNMAKANGVNYVPRLADALGEGRKSITERVYKFPKGEQISVFPSAPLPAGPGNANTSYSPLWRVVMVSWLKPERVRELKSEEEILAFEEKGDLALKVTNVVANCPIVGAADGTRLVGSR